MKRKFKSEFKIPNYNAHGGDGFFQDSAGLFRLREDRIEKVECTWRKDSGTMRAALVDQWGFAHQWA